MGTETAKRAGNGWPAIESMGTDQTATVESLREAVRLVQDIRRPPVAGLYLCRNVVEPACYKVGLSINIAGRVSKHAYHGYCIHSYVEVDPDFLEEAETWLLRQCSFRFPNRDHKEPARQIVGEYFLLRTDRDVRIVQRLMTFLAVWPERIFRSECRRWARA